MPEDPKAIETTYRWVQYAAGNDPKKNPSILVLDQLTCEPLTEGKTGYRVVLDSFWDYNIDGKLDAYKRFEKMTETCPSFKELPPDMKRSDYFESKETLPPAKLTLYNGVRTAAMTWFKNLAGKIVENVQQPKCVGLDNSASLYLEGKQYSLSVYVRPDKQLLTGVKIMQKIGEYGDKTAVFFAELVIEGKQPKRMKITTATDVRNFLGDFTKIFQDKCGNGNK